MMKRGLVILFVLVALLVGPGAVESQEAPAFDYDIGVEVTDVQFVDLMEYTRPWQAMEGGAVALDANGWPLDDAKTVVFDERPCCVFFEEPRNTIDDPDVYLWDMSGTYHLAFTGTAVVVDATDENAFTVQNQVYDETTNTTTAEVVVHPHAQLLIMGFVDTQGGVRDVKLIRPGAAPDQIFDERWLEMLRPFGTLRFMADWGQTNRNHGIAFDDEDNVLTWDERHVPDHATQRNYGPHYGIAYEYMILLANELQSDIWLTIPQPADEDYIRQLALLLRDGNEFTGGRGLTPWLNIYLEDSNEVWNPGFPQHQYNLDAAQAEVAADPDSNLNYPAESDPGALANRRHARRTLEIGQIFAEVFDEDSMHGRIRPVLSHWHSQPGQYEQMLTWIETNYGPPADYLYGIGTAAYFSIWANPDGTTVDALLNEVCSASDRGAGRTEMLAQMADAYGLQLLAYEGAIDNSNSTRDTTNIENRIRLGRDPRLASAIIHHIDQNWFGVGGDLFMYFTALGPNTRHGYYGLTEHPHQRFTPKLQAIYTLMGREYPAGGGGLQATYYAEMGFAGPHVTRTDAEVDFAWGDYAPAWGGILPADRFSVRWQGHVEAPTGGDYTFSVVGIGLMRLWVAGEVQVDQLAAREVMALHSDPITLEAGQRVPIRLDYAVGPQPAQIQLQWAVDGGEAAIIPQTQLYPYTELVDIAALGDVCGELAAAAARDEPLLIPGTSTPPVIDGEIDAVWLHVRPTPLINVPTGTVENEADLSAMVRALYDDDYLYVLWDVTDDVVMVDSEDLWRDDTVELYIDGGNEKAIAFDDNDRGYGYRVDNSPPQPEGRHFVAMQTESGYVIEAAIPWSEVSVTPEPGLAIGFDAQVDDDDDGDTRDGKLAWFSTTEDAWHDPSTIGTAVLGPVLSAAGAVPTVGRAPSAPRIDGELDDIWAAAVGLPLTNVIQGALDGEADLSGEVRLYYDDEALYAMFIVTDDAPGLNDSGAQPWDDDSPELYVDGGNEKGGGYDDNDRQFVFRLDEPAEVRVMGQMMPGVEGLAVGYTQSQYGYQLEVRVPWAAIDVTPAPGMTIGLDVHVNDDDDGEGRDGKLSWNAPEDQSWGDPSTFGTVLLGE